MLTVLWDMSVQQCAHTGKVVKLSEAADRLQAGVSALMWGVFHLPVVVATLFISIPALVIAVPYLLYKDWQLLSGVPAGLLAVAARLGASPVQAAAGQGARCCMRGCPCNTTGSAAE
jgi:hypothetical protein